MGLEVGRGMERLIGGGRHVTRKSKPMARLAELRHNHLALQPGNLGQTRHLATCDENVAGGDQMSKNELNRGRP